MTSQNGALFLIALSGIFTASQPQNTARYIKTGQTTKTCSPQQQSAKKKWPNRRQNVIFGTNPVKLTCNQRPSTIFITRARTYTCTNTEFALQKKLFAHNSRVFIKAFRENRTDEKALTVLPEKLFVLALQLIFNKLKINPKNHIRPFRKSTKLSHIQWRRLY